MVGCFQVYGNVGVGGQRQSLSDRDPITENPITFNKRSLKVLLNEQNI